MKIFDTNFSLPDESLLTARGLKIRLKNEPIPDIDDVSFTTYPYFNGREKGYKIIIYTINHHFCFSSCIAFSNNRNSDHIVVYHWRLEGNDAPASVEEMGNIGAVPEHAWRERRMFGGPPEASHYIHQCIRMDVEHIRSLQNINELCQQIFISSSGVSPSE